VRQRLAGGAAGTRESGYPPRTMTERHHGVVAIVTDPRRTRFFIQQKDEDYPSFPLGYSLFGGRIEPGEAPLDALIRELHEELDTVAATLLEGGGPEHVLTTEVPPTGYLVSLFEVVVTEDMLESLAEAPVREGKRGAVFGRAQLLDMPLVWGLEAVVRAYLEQHGGALDGPDA